MSQKLPGLARIARSVTESAPLALDTLAKQYRAEGRPVIAFGAGEPDAATDSRIIDAVIAVAQLPETHRYSPPLGLPALREEVAHYSNGYLGSKYFTSANVAITNGGKQALWNAFSAILNPGDEVILPSPYWTTYPEQVKLAGGVVRQVPTSAESGHRVTVEQLESVTSPRTRALVITSPSNPTGSVYTADELREIARWAERVGCWVISDEIYHDYVYDEQPFTSIVRELDLDQLIIVNGLAKSHALTGWRLGWIVAPSRLIETVKNFQSHTTGNVSNLSQHAALAALRAAPEVPAQLAETFARRRDVVRSYFERMPDVEFEEPNGAFYYFLDVHRLLDGRYEMEGESVVTSLQLSRFLLETLDLAIVPGEAFGAPGYLRFSYAMPADDLHEGLERLRSFLVS